MVAAIIALAVALLVLSLTTAILAGSVPWIYWKCWRLEARLEELDTTLAELFESMGLRKDQGSGGGS